MLLTEANVHAVHFMFWETLLIHLKLFYPDVGELNKVSKIREIEQDL